MNVTEAEAIVRAGAEAMARGEMQLAQKSFATVTQAGYGSPQVWLLLAHSSRQLNDLAAQEEALDNLLKSDHSNLRGLIWKGDCRVAAGDERAATAFYKRAVAVSSGLPQLPTELRPELTRISEWLREVERRFEEHLSAHIRSALAEADISPRLTQSLDILSGKRQIYHQQPSSYYFPELPQRQFFEREEFPWIKALEAAAKDIEAELQELLSHHENMFLPYLVSTGERPHVGFDQLADNPDWSTFYLWQNGAPVAENAAACPLTLAALEGVPLPHIGTRAPAVFFSKLRAGARIPPHVGMVNTRLICHLPLIVPSHCALRVGNQVREWEPGKVLIFDDTIEHEAWNESEEDRVVLIFDIWRPELSMQEREGVRAVFEAVDTYGHSLPS